MRRLFSLCLLLLGMVAAHAQDTKYTVTLNVPEDGTLSAYAYGKSTYDRRSEYAAGEEVHLTGSLRSEYSFVSWTDEQGRVVCDSLRYTFTMPARNVTLTGHTEYDPENPPGPREDGYTDTWNRLYLRSNPSYGGAFTWGLGAESAQNWLVWTGYEFTVQAYPATGFTFVGWQLDGEIVSTDNPYTFIMPERDMTLYAMYEYDPETPVNPYANKWDKESGELIMTDFRMGHLYEDVMEVTRRDPWHSDWSLVKSATIAGQCTDEKLTYDYPIDCRAITSECNNLEFLDYSRTSGITKFTDGCFSIKSLKQVVLPATTLSIGKYAFRGCESLTTVTCFATTPPVFEGKLPDEQGSGNNYYYAWAFDGLTLDNIIVHVPAEAVPLYQEARGWKEFLILPITQGVQKLTVNLPQANSYKDMFLELVNTKTLQSQRYVITSATSYTFNNLIHNTQHNLYLKNQRGDVLGSIEGIDIVDKDLQVSFSNLKTPIDVTLQLLDPQGNQLTSPQGEGQGVGSVTWTDRQGVYLGQGPTLPQQLSGTQVVCRVKLGETLGRQYQNPADTLYAVVQGSTLRIPLSPLTSITLTGTVTAESTGKTIRGATVTVSQMLNGSYPVTQSTKTDINGHYELTVYGSVGGDLQSPTTITVSHSDYLKASVCPTVLPSDDVLDFSLKDITGTIVDLDLSYTAAVADGEESVTEEGYSNPDNIAYTVYDETHGQELTDISSQYPILVLLGDELAEGTRLRITATSITGDFMPITTTCTVDNNARATAIFGIKEMGQLKASFEMTDNMSVMGVLYDSEGQQVGWAPYKNTELTATHLKDGNYTLVTMSYSELFTSVSSLDNLLSLEGMDDQQMVMNEVTIRSAHITEVKNHSIPVLDEDRFRYTSDATTVSVNKTEVTVGSYVTVRAELAFKPAYVDALSKVRLQFDMPEGCEFVENSMMVGNRTAAYEVDDRRITVLIEDLNDAVRFCVVPTQGGTFEVAAGTRFHLNGATKIQPIGAVTFSAGDLTINVPATTGRRLLPVTGMAVPLSQVEVFDGGVSIGQTTAIGTGYFSVMCPLNNPYNLSEHDIYAVITTPEGIQMQSETKTVKIDRGHLTPVVTYETKDTRGESNNHQFVFDFRTNEVNPKGIKVSALGEFYINFRINFYDENDLLVNDTTAIKDVVLYVMYERRNVETYHVKYNERQKCWFYQPEMNYSNLPINVDVEYTNVLEKPTVDREVIDDFIAEADAYYEESRRIFLETYHIFDDDVMLDDQEERDELDALLQIENPDDATIQRIDQLLRVVIGDSIVDASKEKYRIDFSEVDAIMSQPDLTVEQLEQATDLLNTIISQWETSHPRMETDLESRLTVVNSLISSLETQQKELRDSVLTGLTLFWYPDTTEVHIQQGEQDYIVQYENQYLHYLQHKLTSVNKEQLLEEGYVEMPMTDGSCFLCYADENKECYIDMKNMMLYSREIIDQAEAQARGLDLRRAQEVEIKPLSLIGSLFPQHCMDKFGKFIEDCGSFGQSLKNIAAQADLNNTVELISNFANMMLSSLDGIKCLYDNGVEKLKKFLEDSWKSTLDRLGDDMSKAKLEKYSIECDIADENARISEYSKSQREYQQQIQEYTDKINNPNTGTAERQRCINRRNDCRTQVSDLSTKITQSSAKISGWNSKLNGPIKKAVEKAEKLFASAEKTKKQLIEQVNILLPNHLKPVQKLEIKVASFLNNPPIKALFELGPLMCTGMNCAYDMLKWTVLFGKCYAKLPCEGNPTEAWNLVTSCFGYCVKHTITNQLKLAGEGGNLALGALPPTIWTWLGARVLDLVSAWYSAWQNKESEKDRGIIEKRLAALKCDPDPDDDDSNKPNNGTLSTNDDNDDSDSGGWKININFGFTNLWFVRDPSGYVYEAVNSNRVEGVTTTCYYKETKEDMYGDFHDEAVLWDAETYAQENPLFTDADGRYQWDVPTGLWQVKYEKQGYETTFSDWLPVPPPQLEVNVGITQFKQPNVAKVKAYTNGIDITFDKYMRPNTLKTENIFVTKGGQAISGKIELLNAESGYQTPDSVYASKVRFVANDNLNVNDKIQLTIKKAVESYAGIPMEQDFTQQFTVEQRIEALITDSLVNLAENQEATILVKAVPAAAARGRKVKVTVSDAEVIGLPSLGEGSEVGFDQNGEAKLSVKAEAQGTSVVRFTLTNEELTTTTLITVRNPEQMQVAAPKASRINGTTLYIGSEIRLTCATSGATILYTLDGTCPCDVGSKSVYTYDAPIVLTGDSIHIKAMAVAPGMEDSPVAEYSYKGIQRPDGIEAPTMPDGSPVGTEPVLFFRLNGQRITQPERGITIERSGSQVKKVVRK